jgi:hypothetical protein
VTTTKKPIKKIIRTGFNKDKEQWWTEFQYGEKSFYAMWQVGEKDGEETFQIGIFESSINMEKIDGLNNRTNRNKKTNAKSIKEDA